MQIHFIAIGGSVMHQLAIMMKLNGHQVSGSDDEIFDPALSNLKKYNLIDDNYYWNVNNITSKLDAVILGMHATIDNVELIKAQQLNITIYSYPEYIYEQCKNKIRIIVAGSHGKTTTTSILIHILHVLKKRFDYLVGAKSEAMNFNVSIKNDSQYLISEGDEYLASKLKPQPKFHFYYPHITVITGIAWDHINVFPSFESYIQQFIIYLDTIEPNGIVIYNANDIELKKIIDKNIRPDLKKIPYTLPENFITEMGEQIITLNGVSQKLNIFGNHNLSNLMAAYMVCQAIEISTQDFLKAIGSFNGVEKRLELVIENNNFKVYKDFAHSPSKLTATLNAIKTKYKHKKIIAIYELHTFSSLNTVFLNEYKNTLNDVYESIIYISSHALELKKIKLIDDEEILLGFNNHDIKIGHTKTELIGMIKKIDFRNTIFLLMSSGNFDNLDIKVTFASPFSD